MPDAADVRRITEIFLNVCYDEIGKKPRLMDGQDVHAALGHLMPAHLARADPLGEHVPDVLTAYLDHLEATQVVTEAFETRVEEVEAPVDAPDYVTTFPPGIGGYIAAHDEAIAYLEDVIADCLETLKELKDSRWINAMELSEPPERRG